jgi:hypothetical protein
VGVWILSILSVWLTDRFNFPDNNSFIYLQKLPHYKISTANDYSRDFYICFNCVTDGTLETGISFFNR